MTEPINRDKHSKLQSSENKIVTNTTNSSRHHSLWQRVLLVQGIGWIGAIGILGSNIAWTQEQTANPGSAAIGDIPTTRSQSNLDAPRRAPSQSGRRLRSRFERQRQRRASAVNNNTYIDTTDYRLGATRRSGGRGSTYDAPSSVVLTERATGRQRIITRRQRAIEEGESVARVRTRVRNNVIGSDYPPLTQTIRISEPRTRIARRSRRSLRARPEQPNQFARSRRLQTTRREQPAISRRISRRVEIASREQPAPSRRISRRIEITRPQPTQFESSSRRIQIANRRQSEQLERSGRRSQISRLQRQRPAQIPIEYVNSASRSENLERASTLGNFRRRSLSAWRSRRRGAEVAGIGQLPIGSVSAPSDPVRVRHWDGIRTGGVVSSSSSRGSIPTWPGLAYNTSTSLPQEYPQRPTLPIIFPLSIPSQITSVFGWRIHPISGDVRFHTGTDIGAPMGTPVVAAYPGRVAIADTLSGYGLTVILQHKDGTQETRYAHLSETYVQSGDFVEQGAIIGRVGNTGNSTGPHLHFELRQQTPEGWVALDAGAQLESSLAQLLHTLQIAQSPQSENADLPKLAQPKTQLNNAELPEIIVPNTPYYIAPPPTGG